VTKFEIGEMVAKRGSGIVGQVLGFAENGRLEVRFSQAFNPGRRGAFTTSLQLPANLTKIAPPAAIPAEPVHEEAARGVVRELVAAGSSTELPALPVETGLVPLGQPLTEAEEEATRRLIEGEVVPMPWADWPSPTTETMDIKLLRVQPGDSGMEVTGPLGVIGRATPGFMDGLGYEVVFPQGFIEKLSPRLQVEVINERIASTNKGEFTLVIEDGELIRLAAKGREIIPARRVAEFAHEHLETAFGSVLIPEARLNSGEALLRFDLPVEQPITRAVGDVLRLGLQLEQSYRDGMNVSLYMTRLVCLNGMTADKRAFSWRIKEEKTEAAQLDWLRHALGALPTAYERIVERSRLMAETRFTGDYQTVLRGAARAFGLPSRYLPQLVEAFEQEPGDTWWSVLNAFTRTATHSNISVNTRQALWAGAGDWAGRFEICTAELPRSLASSVGARILEA
jgi:hypothetical protein